MLEDDPDLPESTKVNSFFVGLNLPDDHEIMLQNHWEFKKAGEYKKGDYAKLKDKVETVLTN